MTLLIWRSYGTYFPKKKSHIYSVLRWFKWFLSILLMELRWHTQQPWSCRYHDNLRNQHDCFRSDVWTDHCRISAAFLHFFEHRCKGPRCWYITMHWVPATRTDINITKRFWFFKSDCIAHCDTLWNTCAILWRIISTVGNIPSNVGDAISNGKLFSTGIGDTISTGGGVPTVMGA